MIESMVIRIHSFDNAAMQDNASGEVVTLLKELIQRIEDTEVEQIDGMSLVDSNGNRVGVVSVNLIDEDDIDDEGDEEDFDDLDDA